MEQDFADDDRPEGVDTKLFNESLTEDATAPSGEGSTAAAASVTSLEAKSSPSTSPAAVQTPVAEGSPAGGGSSAASPGGSKSHLK